MILIVGLGNPGKKFENTRHNIGFIALDEIAANFNFPIFNFQSAFNAQISKGKIAGKKVILAKPQTFMNNSGKATVKIIKNLKLQIENLIVIHDDLDLPLGKIKISFARGSAGHKGVESIIKELKTKNFIRLRIGIASNLKLENKKTKPSVKNFVLKDFTKKENNILKEVTIKIIEAIKVIIKEGKEKAMTYFNC